MRRIIAIVLITAAFIAGAYAGPSGFDRKPQAPSAPGGFDNPAPTTVAGVFAHAYDDQIVVLQGRLTKYLGGDHYEFTDNAGDRIEVELDDDKNWSHISKDMPIEIVGEVDKDFFRTSIDVKQARPLTDVPPKPKPQPQRQPRP